MIDNETEARLDELYQRWQQRWVSAKSVAETERDEAALMALQEVYEILGLDTP